MAALDLKAKIAATTRGQPYGLSTTAAAPELPDRAGALPQRLQDIALSYISARQRAGDSLLEMARWMSEARQEAVRGEWYIFLEATNTSANHAESLLAIHARVMSDPLFAAAMRSNFLSLSAGYELLSAPPDVQDRLLRSEQPITRKQIREEKEARKPHAGVGFDEQSMLPEMPEMAQPADLPPEFAIVQRRFAAHGWKLIRHGVWYKLSRPNGELYNTFPTLEEHAAMLDVLDRASERIGDRPSTPPPSATPTRRTCPTCGETLLNGRWGDLDECGSCYHARRQDEVQASQATPAESAAPFWQSMSPQHPTAHLWTRVGMNEHHAACGMVTQRAPSGSTETGHCSSCVRATWKTAAEAPALVTIESLDATIPRSLSDAGFYWKAAEPPTIAHNDGWYTTAETVEAALNLAHDRAQERVEAKDRRLSPGQYVSVMDLIGKLRAAVITGALADVASRARHIAQIAESPEG